QAEDGIRDRNVTGVQTCALPISVAMIEPTRQEILARLERLSELAPDMRFGQMIANLAFMAAGPWDQTLWDLEDEQLVGAIRQMEDRKSTRLNSSHVSISYAVFCL